MVSTLLDCLIIMLFLFLHFIVEENISTVNIERRLYESNHQETNDLYLVWHESKLVSHDDNGRRENVCSSVT